MKVYLLPGIACDHRLFDRIDLNGYDVVKLDWPCFRPNTTLSDIAMDLRERINAEEPHVFIGVSMGGMVAQELAVLTHPQRVVLISSWTHRSEWPWFVRFGSLIGAGRFASMNVIRATWPLKRILGSRDAVSDRLLFDMAMKEGEGQIKRGVQAILHWKGSSWQGPTVRIHGDNDALMPISKVKADVVVKGGTHAMVLCQAEAVSAAINAALAG